MIVWVVDDEPMIVNLLGDIIELAGHEVRRASSSEEVEALLAPEVWADVDALLCDLHMPVGGGRVLAYVSTVAPHVRKVVLTGVPIAQLHDVPADAILEKPAGLDQILEALDA